MNSRSMIIGVMTLLTALAAMPIGSAAAWSDAPAGAPEVGEDGSLRTPNHSGLSRVTRHGGLRGSGAGVAIVASAAGDATDELFTDPQDKLLASGLFSAVTVINAGVETPPLEDLLEFDALLVWSNFDFADAVALGDVLADYVDSPDGGGVVVAVFANASADTDRLLGGRWQSGGYDVVAPQGGSLTGSASLGTIYTPAHPLLVGVSDFSGGLSSYRPASVALHAGATLSASWSDGKPLVAFRSDLPHRRVDLGFYPPSSDVTFFFWTSSSDGDMLLANALSYAAEQDNTDVRVKLIALEEPSAANTTNDPSALPGQIGADDCAESLVVEVWVTDAGVLNTGVTGLYLDVAFDPSRLRAQAVVHSPLFGLLGSGTIDNNAGLVTNFGSNSANFQPQGIEPTWARVGHVQIGVLSAGTSNVSAVLGVGGVGVFGRTAPPPALVSIAPASVALAASDCRGACCYSGGSCTYGYEEECTGFVCNVADHLPGTFGGCFGDADGNGVVNPGDRGFISANIGTTAPIAMCLNDLDGNGVVNPADRGFVSANINQCTPLPDYQNGSGCSHGVCPDPRFPQPVFQGFGTNCAADICP